MKKLAKVFIPILVLALLLQFPMALSASASTLSDVSKLEFAVSAAPEGSPANTQVKLYLTTTSPEEITTIGATLVLKDFDTNFALYNKVGDTTTYEDASSSYKVTKKELGKAFPIEATDIDGDFFADFPSASLASYNSETGEMYLFIAAWNDGVVLTSGVKTEVATFYIQAKDGVTPSNDNMRLMKNNEFKNSNYCLCNAIYPTAISSSDIVLQPSVDDIIQEDDFTLDFPVVPTGTTVSGAFTATNGLADVTITISDGTYTDTTTAKGKSATYSFEEVPAGTYTITLTATGSLGYKIINVVVTDEPKEVPSVALMFGDVDGDKQITIFDITVILPLASTYGYDAAAEVDGDGQITIFDVTDTLPNVLKTSNDMILDLSA